MFLFFPLTDSTFLKGPEGLFFVPYTLYDYDINVQTIPQDIIVTNGEGSRPDLVFLNRNSKNDKTYLLLWTEWGILIPFKALRMLLTLEKLTYLKNDLTETDRWQSDIMTATVLCTLTVKMNFDVCLRYQGTWEIILFLQALYLISSS